MEVSVNLPQYWTIKYLEGGTTTCNGEIVCKGEQDINNISLETAVFKKSQLTRI